MIARKRGGEVILRFGCCDEMWSEGDERVSALCQKWLPRLMTSQFFHAQKNVILKQLYKEVDSEYHKAVFQHMHLNSW